MLLARLRGDEALSALLGYMDGCATGGLQRNPYDEAISPQWAAAAIEYLEPRRSVDTIRLWDAFVERQVPLMRGHWPERLPHARNVFDKVMLLFDEHWA